MSETNYGSCLAPFEREIITLRKRRPPMSFPKIAEYLKQEHKISVRRQTIEAFLKVRAKGYKPCKYAWLIEPESAANQPATETPSLKKQTAFQTSKPKIEGITKPTALSQADGFKMEFSEHYNLHRLTDEQAEAYRQQLKAEKLKKENQ